MLCHGFSCTETAWDGSCTALCDREQSIQDTLSGYKRNACRKTLVSRSWDTNRPFLCQGNILFASVSKADCYDGFKDIVSSVRYCLDNCGSSHIWRNHGFMKDRRGFLGLCNNGTRSYHITLFYGYVYIPFFLSVKRINTYTSGNIFTGGFCNFLQRTLDTIENIMNNTRPQKHGDRISCTGNSFAWLKSCSFLEYLYSGHAFFQANDLTYQMLRSYIDHFGNFKAWITF